MGRGEVHTGIKWENVTEKENLEDQGVDGRIILKRIFRRRNRKMGWMMWLRIRTGGGHWCMR